jgi:hypothetical protein
MITTAFWWLLLPLAVAVAALFWLTESRRARITRWRSQGRTWAAIAIDRETLGSGVTAGRAGGENRSQPRRSHAPGR